MNGIMTHTLTRRNLLKSAAATAVGAGALPLLTQGLPAAAQTRSRDAARLTYTTIAGTPEIPIFKHLGDQFNKTHRNAQASFQLVPGTWEDYNRKLVTQVAGGTVPDVTRAAIIYRPSYVSKGYVEDLMPFAQKSHFPFDQYFKTPFGGYLVDNHLWGMPVGIYDMAMYYNKTMFKEAGIPFPSTNWEKGYDFDQFLSVARKLTKGSGVHKQYGAQMLTDFRWLIHFLWWSGGEFLSADHSKCVLETPQALEGLQYLHDLMFKYQVWPNPETLKNGVLTTGLFTSGRVGMYLDGMWQMPTMKAIKNFEWGVAPLPRNKKIATGYYIDGWFVPKGAPNPELSWELIASFMSAQTEDYLAHQSDLGIPMLKSTAQKDANFLFNPLPPNEQKVWLDSPNHGHQFPWTPNFADIQQVLSRNLDLFALQKTDVKQTARNITQQVQPLLDKLTPAEKKA